MFFLLSLFYICSRYAVIFLLSSVCFDVIRVELSPSKMFAVVNDLATVDALNIPRRCIALLVKVVLLYIVALERRPWILRLELNVLNCLLSLFDICSCYVAIV